MITEKEKTQGEVNNLFKVLNDRLEILENSNKRVKQNRFLKNERGALLSWVSLLEDEKSPLEIYKSCPNVSKNFFVAYCEIAGVKSVIEHDYKFQIETENHRMKVAEEMLKAGRDWNVKDGVLEVKPLHYISLVRSKEFIEWEKDTINKLQHGGMGNNL